MHNLLKFEYRRLFYRTSLYVCFAVVIVPVLFMFIVTAASYLSAKNNGELNLSLFSNTMYGIVSQMIKSANLTLLSVIFTSVFVCEDQTRGTIKTIYSLGYPRAKLSAARFLASATATAIMYWAVILIALICGTLFSSTENRAVDPGMIFGLTQEYKEPDVFVFIIQQFAVIMGAHSFYYLMAQISQKTGISIVLGIFIPGMISSGFGVITMIFSYVFNSNNAITDALGKAYMTFLQYWLPSMLSSLLSEIGMSSELNYAASIIVNIGYIVAFGAFAVLISYKKEIK